MQKPISSIVHTGWHVVTAAVVAVIVGLFVFIRPPSTAQASQAMPAVAGATAEYVGSDPSLPSAASVKLPDIEPLPPTF